MNQAAKTRSPRSFFDEIVEPSFRSWLADELCEWKAKAAVSNLDIMAATCFVFWNAVDPTKIRNSASERAYREHLVASECGDFGLVWDIHDAHKHIKLNSVRTGGRAVHRSDQTGVDSLGWDEARWDEGRWDSPDELVITMDSSEKRSVRIIAQNVFDMWERLLSDWSM